MWWAIFKGVQVILAAVLFGLFYSHTAHAWPATGSVEYQLSEVKVVNPYICAGTVRVISVSGEGSREACVMGNTTKVASYYSIDGWVMYAVSFPFDEKFYRLNVCENIWGCVYNEQTDTLTGLRRLDNYGNGGVIYKRFVEDIKQTIQGGVIRYELSEHSLAIPITHPGGLPFYAQTVASSDNGKWLLIEVREYGIYRVNAQTLEIRRVVAPGFKYGIGNDPFAELAISNDGKMIAVVGMKLGVWLVEVNDSCGDWLSELTHTSYEGAVTACRFLYTPTNEYIDRFLYATRPRFSQDSGRLSFNIYGNGAEPRHVVLFSDSSYSQDHSEYLAIGESFVSGEGENDALFYIGGATNKCHVSSRSYPYLLASAWGVSGHNAACSGATIHEARGRGAQPNQLAEIEKRTPKLITVGIGGNDAGFMGKLKSCLGPGTCEWVETIEKRQSTALEIKNLYPEIKQFYQDLQAMTPGKVIVIGYPLIISAEPSCPTYVGLLLNQAERQFMVEGIKYLNQVVKAAANDAGLDFVDVEGVYSGNELCTLGSLQLMNGLRLGSKYPVIDALPDLKLLGSESFHPTPEGHRRMAKELLLRLPTASMPISCVTCAGVDGPPPPNDYWGEPIVNSKPQRALLFINKIIVKNGDSFEISLPAFSFEPMSDVVLELHSDIKILGTAKSAADGSLQFTVEVAAFDTGFHTVHVIGKSFTGQTVDVYDFVTVEGNAPQEIVAPIAKTNQSSRDTKIQVAETVASAEVLGASLFNIPATKENILRNRDQFIPKEAFPIYLGILIVLGIGIMAVWVLELLLRK